MAPRLTLARFLWPKDVVTARVRICELLIKLRTCAKLLFYFLNAHATWSFAEREYKRLSSTWRHWSRHLRLAREKKYFWLQEEIQSVWFQDSCFLSLLSANYRRFCSQIAFAICKKMYASQSSNVWSRTWDGCGLEDVDNLANLFKSKENAKGWTSFSKLSSLTLRKICLLYYEVIRKVNKRMTWKFISCVKWKNPWWSNPWWSNALDAFLSSFPWVWRPNKTWWFQVKCFLFLMVKKKQIDFSWPLYVLC